MTNKIFRFGQMIYEWLSQFAPTYRGVLPSGVSPEEAYIRFDGYFDNFADAFIFPVILYKQKTTSYASVLELADKIESAVGDGGICIGDRGMRVHIEKGSPFYQDRADEDETVRSGYINLQISVYAVTAPTRFMVYYRSMNYKETLYDVKYYEEGDAIELPENKYLQVGYKFTGWRYKDMVYQAGETFIMPAEDVIFEAEWQAIQYVINFFVDGEFYKSITYTIFDEFINSPPVPDKEGKQGYWQTFVLGRFPTINVNAIYVDANTAMWSGMLRAGNHIKIRRKSA